LLIQAITALCETETGNPPRRGRESSIDRLSQYRWIKAPVIKARGCVPFADARRRSNSKVAAATPEGIDSFPRARQRTPRQGVK